MNDKNNVNGDALLIVRCQLVNVNNQTVIKVFIRI